MNTELMDFVLDVALWILAMLCMISLFENWEKFIKFIRKEKK